MQRLRTALIVAALLISGMSESAFATPNQASTAYNVGPDGRLEFSGQTLANVAGRIAAASGKKITVDPTAAPFIIGGKIDPTNVTLF